MNKLIFAFLLSLSVNANAAETLCGVQVQKTNITLAAESKVGSVNFIRALAKADNGEVTECFSEKGAIVVTTYPDGEVRAFIF